MPIFKSQATLLKTWFILPIFIIRLFCIPTKVAIRLLLIVQALDQHHTNLWSQSPIFRQSQDICKSLQELPTKPGGQKRVAKENNQAMVEKNKKQQEKEKKQKPKEQKPKEDKQVIQKPQQQQQLPQQQGGQAQPRPRKGKKDKKMDWKCVHSKTYYAHMAKAKMMSIPLIEAKLQFNVKLADLERDTLMLGRCMHMFEGTIVFNPWFV